MPGQHPNKTVLPLIALNGSLSQSVPVVGKLTSIVMPSGWDAADITFQGSLDDLTFNDMYDAFGNEITVNAAASRLIVIDKVEGATFIKVRSGTSAVPVLQTAARTLTLLVRKDPIP